MSQKEVCLTPQRIVPGSKLARAAKRADGNLLLTAGTELDRDQLAQLFERGIEFVYVEANDTRDEAAIARDVAAAAERVDHIFRGSGSDSRTELHKTVARYRRKGAE
jgi:hypothetical protein